jgi:hypothetical protein
VLSLRSLLMAWAGFTLATVGYAYIDLALSPGLHVESGFSVTLDVARIGELWHWGGRLVREGALVLLVCNAVIVGGVLALLTLWIAESIQHVRQYLRASQQRREERAPSAVAFGSVPPPPAP